MSYLEYTTSTMYRAPEGFFPSMGYSGAVDLWSTGCIMAELILGRVFIKTEQIGYEEPSKMWNIQFDFFRKRKSFPKEIKLNVPHLTTAEKEQLLQIFNLFGNPPSSFVQRITSTKDKELLKLLGPLTFTGVSLVDLFPSLEPEGTSCKDGNI